MRSAPGLRQVHGALAVILLAFALRRRLRARVVHLAVSFTSCSPSWSFRALRRSNRCSDRSRTLLAFHPLAIGDTSPTSQRPRVFATPRRFTPQPASRPCFVPVPSMGFRPFGGFSPPVAPRTSRSSVSSVPLSRLRGTRLRGCQHRPDACRRFVGLALAALAPPLVVSPLRGLYLPVSLRASASLLSWAFSWAPSDRSALRLCDPRASQRALQSFREPEGRLGLRRVSLHGVLADTGIPPRGRGPCLAPRGCVLGSWPACADFPAEHRHLRPLGLEIGRAHV